MRIPHEEIKFMLAPGKLDILTVIPTGEIILKGIPFVKSLLKTTNPTAWAAFWSYFTKTWMNTYGIVIFICVYIYISISLSLVLIFLIILVKIDFLGLEVWNVNAMSDDQVRLRNRTNNPIERYNRELNRMFPTSHPNLFTFIETVKLDSISYLKKIDIKKGVRVAAIFAGTARYIQIPREYHAYRPA